MEKFRALCLHCVMPWRRPSFKKLYGCVSAHFAANVSKDDSFVPPLPDECIFSLHHFSLFSLQPRSTHDILGGTLLKPIQFYGVPPLACHLLGPSVTAGCPGMPPRGTNHGPEGFFCFWGRTIFSKRNSPLDGKIEQLCIFN